MKECCKKCISVDRSCRERDCGMWIDYKEDLNCTLIAVENNKSDSMTLEEVSKRLNISIVRVKQIQDKALQKIKKKRNLTF